MDRLNQLRGDVGGSRESSLDASSLAGEAYLTANESSKYFSLSQLESSTASSPPKEGVGDISPGNTLSDAERIISNLSPIPKKSELDSFQIGDQIEAANILSGGVNIFDDNDNSYDGDELVIDDAAVEGDDKPEELKLSEEVVETFDKTEGLADTNTEDSEAASSSKDTEVVLQIDGKNVDAIDIGNGLYLYRKEGEEELAVVQILDNNQQQPEIKFLKVRENAEGNLEVYEEIEIEVPKEAPAKEGKAVKNTPHIPVKDLNSELASNKVAEQKIQIIPKDTDISDAELDVNTDNNHIESKTEVNLNGKMIKFSESRKSPLIGTFTPMTYHSTPNKEGIPLTKTMVDLQLHPNRHSENVKKTIEVHTDNCKQKLLETPIKNIDDSNESIKHSEFLSSSMDKDLPHDISAHGEDHNTYNIALNENKTDEIITSNNDINIKLLNEQNKPLLKSNVEGNFIKQHKTEMAEERILASEGAHKNVITELSNEKSSAKPLSEVNPINENCSTANSDIGKNKIRTQDLPTVNADETHSEYSKSESISVNKTVLKDIADKEGKTISSISDKAFDTVENQDKSDISIKRRVELPKKDICDLKDAISGIETENNAEKSLESTVHPSDLSTNQGISKSQNEYKNLELLDSLTKDVKLDNSVSLKVSDNEPAQSLTKSVGGDKDKKIITNTGSVQSDLQKEIDTDLKSKPLQLEKSAQSINNSQKVTEIKKDVLLQQPESIQNVSHNLATQKELVPVLEFKPHKDEHKDVFKIVEKKNDTDLKADKKPVDILMSSPKKLKINESTDLMTTANENKTKQNVSTGSVNKIDAVLNQRDCISSKKTVHTVEPTGNPQLKNSQKAFEQKCTRNPPSNMKVHNKNESNPKVPNLVKNTKPFDSKTHLPIQSAPNQFERSRNDVKKETTKDNKATTPIPVSDEYDDITEVPFGKWTEENRQIFLNRMKGPKVSTNTSNTKQLKQPNDLNRRDILQKIDSQRQSNIASAKAQELKGLNKTKLKHDIGTFGSKSHIIQKEKNTDNKTVTSIQKVVQSVPAIPLENKVAQGKNLDKAPSLPINLVDMSNTTVNAKKDCVRRNQDLIDKTIEGIINRAVTAKIGQDEGKSSYSSVALDEIESKMNELHGIPFVERPPHQLPQVIEHDNKSIEVSTASEGHKTSLSHKPSQIKENKVTHSVATRVHEDSEEEIIEHIPVTGDIGLKKNNVTVYGAGNDKIQESLTKLNNDSKREPIITENDFDKFARRNSITYENRLTVNFDGKEHHNVIQTVVEKETMPKKLSRNEMMLAESKAKCNKQLASRHTNISSKIPTMIKPINSEDSYNKNYQSKVQIAYQSVMTAKRQQECPVTIIEDKPVKVLFVEGNHEYTPHPFSVQGNESSPPKKTAIEWDHFMHSNSESLDSSESALDAGYDSKSQDDMKFKSKHQRKQVLTPVEAPDLELIEPKDLGIDVSPKKKRKVEDHKTEKNNKSLVPKKSYLLNRNITNDVTPSNSHDLTKRPLSDSVPQQEEFVKRSDAISAIDNLVKAAELLENQTETKNVILPNTQNSPTQQSNSIKRGRGRPRKYPIMEPGSDAKSPSPVKTPPKRPRLIDAKIPKYETDSEDAETDIDGELVTENWSMGKINPKIICPICNKLFRTEYVVFKHVKHCTGSSPNRSDSDKRSPRRVRQSQELDWKSEGSKSDSGDIDEDSETDKLPTEKRKSRREESSADKPDVKADNVEIEDTPVKDNPTIRKRDKMKNDSNKAIDKTKTQQQTNNLVCEFCGKIFRQLSYLVSHRLQHKNTESKKVENEPVHTSVFSCEICKKEFRKLHHLVQHRNIHTSMSCSRKSSSEQSDSKTTKEASRETEDQSAGFRCEPCDKSFRKLHHLVEHRETHDEINKKSNPVTTSGGVDTMKPNPLHHCDICKKTFKKLQHLIDHKEQHLDTSSEKSDDKSVKSSLSTKDIIHECPLCYMVFPNEHSLNKHHIICQRKKKQSAAKQSKQINESEVTEIDDETQTTEADNENLASVNQNAHTDTSCIVVEDELPITLEKQEPTVIQKDITLLIHEKEDHHNQIKPVSLSLPLKSEIDIKTQDSDKQKLTNKKDDCERNVDKVTSKIKKQTVPTTGPVEIITIPDTPTPKKRLISRDKIAPTVTKRQKTSNVPLPDQNAVKTPDTSDDDEVRYMLNPDFQIDESSEGKLFMKVRAQKRNSLQIERPNSKDLMKRRISLQHPPKIPRFKNKPITRKPINTNTIAKSSKTTPVPVEPATDSDDSDVKYSFPETIKEEMTMEEQKKAKKQTVIEKRKSLSSIAKRKSLGMRMNDKRKVNPTPVKQIKKRSAEAEHRCDCGQLFSSVALLMRHTSLAHTPPRIRRRRSPPPDDNPKPSSKRSEKPQLTGKATKSNPIAAKTGVATRKSSVNSDAKANANVHKTSTTSKTRSLVKTPRSNTHKGVPVPEKMRKLMEKSKK